MKALRIVVLYSLTFSSLLAAGPRLYEIEKPLKAVMESVIDAIARDLPFQIVQIYDGKADGKEGFVIRSRPRNLRSEFLFFQTEHQNSRIAVRSQDVHDGNRIAKALLGLGFKEIGASDKEIEGRPWPVRPF